MSLRARLSLLVVGIAGAAIVVITVLAVSAAERLVFAQIDDAVLLAANAPETGNGGPFAGASGSPVATPQRPGRPQATTREPPPPGQQTGQPTGQVPEPVPGQTRSGNGSGTTPGRNQDDRSIAWVSIDVDGSVREAIASTGDGVVLALPDATSFRRLDGGFTVREVRTVGGIDQPDVPYRATMVPVPRGGYVLVGQPIDASLAEIARIRWIGFGAALLAMMLAALGGFVGVGQALRPLTAMQNAAATLADGDLSRRVNDDNRTDEVGELARAFNDMADSVEAAMHERDRSAEQLRQFVADASHELRTPLTSIVGYADLHRAGALVDTARTDHAMDRIGSEALRLMSLVEDLLALARLDLAREPRLEPLDIAQVTREVVADAKAASPERTIVANIPNLPVTILGDQDQLRQVVTNLLANARQHTFAPNTIEVAVEHQVGIEVRVVVSDNGDGLDTTEAERVFDRFWRGDPARTRNASNDVTARPVGSGLGLAIAAGIAHAHAGRVSLVTRPGEGCRFTLHLPIRPPETASD